MMVHACEIIFWISIFIIIYSYLLYPVTLTIFSRAFGRPTLKNEQLRPIVAVLVPVHNEENVIRKKIENILNLDYPPEKLWIWIGSDCSTDATEQIVRDLGHPRINLWRAPERGGKTGVINRLAPLIDADIILFTDANTMHRRDCLRAMVRHFADPEVGGVAGHIDHVLSDEDEYAETFYRTFESKQKFMEGLLHSTISAFGGFYALRSPLFRPIPANAYSNDDVLIPMNVVRQGFRVVYDAEAVSEEDVTEGVKTEFKRRIRIGAGNFQAFFWLLDFLNPLKGWPFFCYVSHKVTRWFSPLFFTMAALSCIFLFFASGRVLYSMIFMAGLVLSVAGVFHKFIPLRITRHIFYFIAMNTALVLGFFRFIIGIRSAAWSRTERV